MNAAISTQRFECLTGFMQDPKIGCKSMVLTHPHSTKTDFFVWFRPVWKPV